jgi:hypothetical protein
MTPRIERPNDSEQHIVCGRCRGSLAEDGDERYCILCGWRDYNYQPEQTKVSGFSHGFLLQYIGDNQRWKTTVLDISFVKPQPRQHGEITNMIIEHCPFSCGLKMAYKSRHGGHLFSCAEEHLVTLSMDDNKPGWW